MSDDTIEINATLTIAASDLPAPQVPESEVKPEPKPEPAPGLFPMSVDELREMKGSTVILVGHHKGSRRGGGIYVYDEENTLDNNATHIGNWVLMPDQVVTPYHFGASEDGSRVDSSEAVQAWFDFCATSTAGDYRLEGRGSFGTTRTIKAHRANTLIEFDLWLYGLVALDDVLHIHECKRGTQWSGKIGIDVSGSRHLRAREGINGVRVEDCARAIIDCSFYAKHGRGWGLYFTGHNNMARIGDVETIDMGASGHTDRTHTVTVDNFKGYLSHGNIHQTTVLTLSEDSVIPAAAHQMTRAWWVSAAGNPYLISGLDREANTLTVYPYVPESEQLAEGSMLIYGGGVCCYSGGHTAKARIGHVMAMRSGTGLWLTGSSSSNVDGITGQFNGVDIALGHSPKSAFGGSFIGSAYFEGNTTADLIHVNQTRSFSNGSMIGSVTALDLERWISLIPNGSQGRKSNSVDYMPVSFMRDGQLVVASRGNARDNDAKGYGLGASLATINTPRFMRAWRGSVYINLSTNHLEASRGVEPRQIQVYGYGKNGEYKFDLEVRCEEGYTINGQEGPLTITRREHPYTVHAMVSSQNDWTVTIVDHIMPS